MASRASFPSQKDMCECVNSHLLGMHYQLLKEKGVVDKTAEVFANRTMTPREVVVEAGTILYNKALLPPLCMEYELVNLLVAITLCADKKKI